MKFWSKKHHLGIFMLILIVILIGVATSYIIDTSYSYDYLGPYNDGTVLDCYDKNITCIKIY